MRNRCALFALLLTTRSYTKYVTFAKNIKQRPPVPDEKPLSTGEVARLLHVTPVAVFHWVRSGKLKACRVPGGRYRISRTDFRKFLADNQIPVTLDTLAPKRILVVDDDPAVLAAFEAVLQAKGHEVVLAANGREARRHARHNPFDLIFLDVLLPDVGGASVLKTIKRRDPDAVVVLITGYPHHEETMAALEFGPAMLLSKPIKLVDIEAVLKMVFKDQDTASKS
jgi:two-component system, OmpR family, response regulator VicR